MVYSVMAEPPSSTGAFQFRLTTRSPAVAMRFRGAEGVVTLDVGVAFVEAEVPSSSLFTALTL